MSLEGSRRFHLGMGFEGVAAAEAKDEFDIRGVWSPALRFLGKHKKVKGWTFKEIEGKTYLLIPLRYALLCFLFGKRVEDIYLLRKEEKLAENG